MTSVSRIITYVDEPGGSGTVTPDFSNYRLEGDNSAYRLPSGLVAPFVTKGGQEDGVTPDSGGAVRVSGVSIQHTPATKLWFGQVHNLAGYRSVPHHHGEAETGGFVLSGRARGLRPRVQCPRCRRRRAARPVPVRRVHHVTSSSMSADETPVAGPRVSAERTRARHQRPPAGGRRANPSLAGLPCCARGHEFSVT